MQKMKPRYEKSFHNFIKTAAWNYPCSSFFSTVPLTAFCNFASTSFNFQLFFSAFYLFFLNFPLLFLSFHLYFTSILSLLLLSAIFKVNKLVDAV